jgi:hypothetical protein
LFFYFFLFFSPCFSRSSEYVQAERIAAEARWDAIDKRATSQRKLLAAAVPPKMHPINLFSRPHTFFSMPQEAILFHSLDQPAVAAVAAVATAAAGAAGAAGGSSAKGKSQPSPKPLPRTESFVTVLKHHALQQPSMLAHVFDRLKNEGVDVTGIRLVHPDPEHSAAYGQQSMYTPPANQPSFLVACTGPAGSLARWLDAVGPADVVLAKQTDPHSLRACWGIDREQNILHVARWVDSGKRDLAFWFGGRVLPGHGTSSHTPRSFLPSCVCTGSFASCVCSLWF